MNNKPNKEQIIIIVTIITMLLIFTGITYSYFTANNPKGSTAQIISEKLQIPYYIEKELREINMGIWENKSFKYIKDKYAKDYENRGKYIDTFKVEGGETFEQCYKRSVNILNELCNKNKNKNIVLVCHSGIIKCLICYIKQIPLKDIMTIKLNYGQITSINYENEKYTIY